jgi:hypothetical protein
MTGADPFDPERFVTAQAKSAIRGRWLKAPQSRPRLVAGARL